MGRKRFGDMNCGIAQSLEVLGDWWTLLIVRDAFFGARRFGDFEANLGIAKNILSDRLSHLVEHGIFAKQAVGESAQRFEYRLTEKGEALLPVLSALRDWSDEWVFGPGHEPVVVKDRRTNRRIARLRVTDADGRVLTRHDLHTEPGPGASAETIRLLQRLPRRAVSWGGRPTR
jgi:DNA-binding HxlR family transcriptional regulator